MALSNAAFASTTEKSLTQVIEAMFGVQPGYTILKQLAVNTETSSLADVANFLVQFSDDATDKTTFSTKVVMNLGITTDAGISEENILAANDYVENILTDDSSNWGASILNIATAFAGFAGDEIFGAAATSFNASVIASLNYSLDEANTDINAGGDTTTNFSLTTGQDNLTGTNADDFFAAYIFDNQNTAQSGDVINGGLGVDTLFADIGTSQNFAITLGTNSVENFAVRAQADSVFSDSNENNMSNGVQIDAERMHGTTRYESNNSRADVTIEDVRILRKDAYSDETDQITQDVTVAMVSTDAGNVDLGVYFDQHSLVQEGDRQSNSITLTVGNQLEVAKGYDAENPLADLPYSKVGFLVNDEAVVIELDLANVTTYDQMWALVEIAFNAEKESNDLLSNVTMTRLIASDRFVARDGDPRAADEYVLTISEGLITPHATVGWEAGALLAPNNAFSATVLEGTPDITSSLVTANILLDDVGRGSMGGDLIVGGMSIGQEESLGEGTSNSKGVEQFDIVVERNSQLQEIQSTNNTLEVVNIVNGTNKGDLTVAGDTNLGFHADDLPGTDSNTAGLLDVRVVNASAMEGSVHINAELSSDVVAKYMNLKDIASDPSADNIEFNYDLGTNDDSLNLVISNVNFANAGATTREDFILDVNGNGGDDVINTIIGNGSGTTATNWYANSKLNANLMVSGDAGNDTITTTGAGDFIINAGSGNDTVYTNNDGIGEGADFVAEIQALTFGKAGDLDTQGQVTVRLSDGQTFTTTGLVNGSSATQVASAVKIAMAGIGNDVTAVLSGSQIFLTYGENYTSSSNKDIAPATISNIATDSQMTVAAGTDGTGTPASDATLERLTINTADFIGSETEIEFANDGTAGSKVTVKDTDKNGTITAFEVAEQIKAHSFVDYELDTSVDDNKDGEGFNPSLGQVYLVAKAAGVKTDMSIASAAASTAITNQGADAVDQVDGTFETQTLTITHGADRAGEITLTIGGQAHPVAISLGNEANVATEVTAFINTLDGMKATQGASGAATANEIEVEWTVIGNKSLISMIDGALISYSVAEAVKGIEASAGNAATWVVNAVELNEQNLESGTKFDVDLLEDANNLMSSFIL